MQKRHIILDIKTFSRTLVCLFFSVGMYDVHVCASLQGAHTQFHTHLFSTSQFCIQGAYLYYHYSISPRKMVW